MTRARKVLFALSAIAVIGAFALVLAHHGRHGHHAQEWEGHNEFRGEGDAVDMPYPQRPVEGKPVEGKPVEVQRPAQMEQRPEAEQPDAGLVEEEEHDDIVGAGDAKADTRGFAAQHHHGEKRHSREHHGHHHERHHNRKGRPSHSNSLSHEEGDHHSRHARHGGVVLAILFVLTGVHGMYTSAFPTMCGTKAHSVVVVVLTASLIAAEIAACVHFKHFCHEHQDAPRCREHNHVVAPVAMFLQIIFGLKWARAAHRVRAELLVAEETATGVVIAEESVAVVDEEKQILV